MELTRALQARLECPAQGCHGLFPLPRRWLYIASISRLDLNGQERAAPRSGAASSYFTRAGSGEWAQGYERAKSTHPDKPTRRSRAGARESTVASSSTPSEANLPARQLRGVFYLTPTAPGAFGSDRSEVGCIAFPRPWQQNWDYFLSFPEKGNAGEKKGGGEENSM